MIYLNGVEISQFKEDMTSTGIVIAIIVVVIVIGWLYTKWEAKYATTYQERKRKRIMMKKLNL